jgi:hypothetical protein
VQDHGRDLHPEQVYAALREAHQVREHLKNDTSDEATLRTLGVIFESPDSAQAVTKMSFCAFLVPHLSDYRTPGVAMRMVSALSSWEARDRIVIILLSSVCCVAPAYTLPVHPTQQTRMWIDMLRAGSRACLRYQFSWSVLQSSTVQEPPCLLARILV